MSDKPAAVTSKDSSTHLSNLRSLLAREHRWAKEDDDEDRRDSIAALEWAPDEIERLTKNLRQAWGDVAQANQEIERLERAWDSSFDLAMQNGSVASLLAWALEGVLRHCDAAPTGETEFGRAVIAAREVLSGKRSEVETTPTPLQTERDVLVLLLGTLVRKLDAIHEDPRYKAVWESFMIHGGRYEGPKYEEELGRARAFLASLTTGNAVETSQRHSIGGADGYDCAKYKHPPAAIKTVTTNQGLVYACEMCSAYWFRKYGDDERAVEATPRDGIPLDKREPQMAMLPNNSHPGPGCSCRECLDRFPSPDGDH